MNICLIGDGLISLTLARALTRKKIKVCLYHQVYKKFQNNNSVIGITSNNLNFIQKEIIKINPKFLWEINKIQIYNKKNKEKKILDFKKSKKRLFSIIKNYNLYKLLINNLKKDNYFKKIKIKDKYFYNKIINDSKFDLIINCEEHNQISKKHFYNNFVKNYNSTAYTTVIHHKKKNNQKAIQIFTELGPLAFLPISKSETSIVYSITNQSIKYGNKLNQIEFNKLILSNNKDYVIKSIEKFNTFKLVSKTLRNYYFKNILCFGNVLHKIHPLAGQGYNMSLRDIKILIDMIKYKKDLGLPIDYSIYENFENKTKHINSLFEFGNDFIYEFFKYKNNYYESFQNKLFSYLNKNDSFKNFAIKYGDRGISI